MANIIPMRYWKVYEFPWGSAVYDARFSRWVSLFLKPDAQEIKVEHLKVVLHQNGIEFLL